MTCPPPAARGGPNGSFATRLANRVSCPIWAMRWIACAIAPCAAASWAAKGRLEVALGNVGEGLEAVRGLPGHALIRQRVSPTRRSASVHRNLCAASGHAGRPSVMVRAWALDHGRPMQPDPKSFTLADAFEQGWHVTGQCARCSASRTPDLGEVVRRAGSRPLARLWASQALRCGECRAPLASLTIFGQQRSVGPRRLMLQFGPGVTV